jgi:N-acetylmuramoyl-L-alanine amidase
MNRQGKYFIALWCAVLSLSISASGPAPGEQVILKKGAGQGVYISDFRRDGEIILLPFQESLNLLGLSGFSDHSAQALFVKVAGKLVVVDMKSGETAFETNVYSLSRPPLVETRNPEGDERILLPEDFYTGPLAHALGENVEVLWIKPQPSEPKALIPHSSCRDPVDIVVIDPGHGGDDLGAEGPDNLLEKNLTLTLALLLKNSLEKEPGLRVILTRNCDKELDLDERARIANARNADLFLSLHANAAEYVHASGFETFFLSLEATDEAARKLAWLENQGLESRARPDSNSNDLELILGDMAQTEHLKDSEFFAAMIQENLARVMKSENRGVKQAPFRVLMQANMPAVLVEVGFLSNQEEARNITRPANQKKIAQALADSIIEYRNIQQKRQGLVPKDQP